MRKSTVVIKRSKPPVVFHDIRVSLTITSQQELKEMVRALGLACVPNASDTYLLYGELTAILQEKEG